MINPVDAYAYLAAIITSSDDAIISKDLHGNITSWNPSAERIFGYTEEEIVGKHISLLVPAEYLSQEDMILRKIKSGERVEHLEVIRRTKSGKLVDLSVTISPIRNASNDIIGASKVARDITSVKEAQRTHAYLGAIIESSDDAIISKDLNGFVTSWNKSAQRIFGYTSEEIVGRHITLLIPPDQLDEEDKILTTLRTGERVDHFETRRRHKNGSIIPVSLTVSPIRDAGGNIIGASKISRDISDRINAEKAIQEMSLRKDEFLANMSHELRTPMNAVIGLANLLKMMALPDKAKQFVDTLKLSADHLMELINDLLDFAKIDSGALELESIEFNLAEQIEKAISVTNVRAKEKNLVLYVNYPTPLNRYFLGDPLRIHQVLMNLLSNAIKFTDKGSIEVDVSGAPNPATGITLINLKVSDTGIGIAETKIKDIFDKFTQADSTITRRYGGSGLGLAIIKALIDKMGGTIHVESELGVGSSFNVTLPLKATDRISAIESFTAATSPDIPVSDKNVLLVEDYEPNVLVTTAMLGEMGYNFDVAQNGFEALRKFAHGNYDIILMDVQMHDLDGLEATRRIRRMEIEKALPRTPIVAMTAHVREQDKDKCLEVGMDDFIPKPFDPNQLAMIISRYVRLKQEVRSLAATASQSQS